MATLRHQVRAREMEYEMRQACELKERKGKRRQKLQHLLKELWRAEQETMLAEECSMALHCIGEAHTAAILVMQHQEARNEERARQLEVNQQREASRYNTALEKERLRRKLELTPKTTAKRRKKVKDSVAQWERSLGRFASHYANFNLLSRRAMPSGWLAVHKKNSPLLQPSDYKHTFLHSHFFMNWDEANVSFKYNEIDAWKAAEVQRQIMKSYKIMQNKIQYVMSKRKVLRGQLAGSKLMIEQKLQLLERENHVIERSEKENKRNTLCHENVAKPSKALSQGVEVKANRGDVLDEVSRKTDQDLLIKGDQVLELTSSVNCGNVLAKQVSTLVENVQEDPKSNRKENAKDDDTTFLSCSKDLRRNDGCKLSKERVSPEKRSKVSFKSLSCRINKK